MKQKRITCLLGAGAVIEIGGPTTDKITECVCNALKSKDIPDCIKYNLTGNFEERFHLLEILSSFHEHTHAPITTILQRKDTFKDINWGNINSSCNTLLETIGKTIDSYNCSWKMKPQNDWFVKFWKKLNVTARLDIVTLNYDTCIEQSLNYFEDGFSEKLDVMGIHSHHAYRFHPKALHCTNKSKVMHLHGCINYGMGTTHDVNKYAFDDSFHDLYKYDSHNAAIEHWYGHSNPSTQAGENIYVGPIITGLRKTEKLLVHPYLSYHYEFQYALRNNHTLLIVGYSCGDEYINAELMRMKQLHGNKRRIVVISYMSNDVRNNWHRDQYCRNWPEEKAYYMLSHLMGCSVAGLLDSFRIPTMDVITSDDKCVQWYVCGFKKSVEKYKMDIIKFLTK